MDLKLFLFTYFCDNKHVIYQKYIFVLIVFMPIIFLAMEKTIYTRRGVTVDPSLVGEKVGDSARKVNTIFHFKNDTRSFFIKVLNLEGKTYAQGISDL